jgi:hypothetical protein
VELVPFRAAIEAGVDAVMTAHVAVPALAPPELPATLSPAILTGLLRDELGFHGLVITDALEMGGIAKGFSTAEAAVRALEAGADTLLMPSDPEAAIRAVVAAVASGRLKRQRIRESVVKILSAKEKLGLDRKRLVNLEGLGDIIDSPESAERAQQIAERAVTLVRNRDNLVPLAEADQSCFVTMAESRYGGGSQALAAGANHPSRSRHVAGRRGGRHGPHQLVPSLHGGRIFHRGRLPRIGGNGGRARAGHGDAGRLWPSGSADRDGESLPVARLSQRECISRDVQHGAAFGDCRGESAVGRDRHRRASAGNHTGPSRVGRRDSTGGDAGGTAPAIGIAT